MSQGRIYMSGAPRGAAFLIAPDLAITAAHVVRSALEARHKPPVDDEIRLQLLDGPQVAVAVEKLDPTLDVATLRLPEPFTDWFDVVDPIQGAQWEATSQ